MTKADREWLAERTAHYERAAVSSRARLRHEMRHECRARGALPVPEWARVLPRSGNPNGAKRAKNIKTLSADTGQHPPNLTAREEVEVPAPASEGRDLASNSRSRSMGSQHPFMADREGQEPAGRAPTPPASSPVQWDPRLSDLRKRLPIGSVVTVGQSIRVHVYGERPREFPDAVSALVALGIVC